jgi:ribosomal protein S18 acetylase RimI-like enzyme
MSSFLIGSDRVEFRLLEPDDYDDIIAVWEYSDLPHKPKGRDSREEIARQMTEDPDMFLGCVVDGNLVGVIIGSYDFRKGYINRIAVVPVHRRKGIGGELISRMERTLHNKGFRVITTLVEDSSTGSPELFSKMGYRRHEDIGYYSKRESDEA